MDHFKRVAIEIANTSQGTPRGPKAGTKWGFIFVFVSTVVLWITLFAVWARL